ncbi:unnamed protein product [Thlaspi arvense]|uniref:RING-type domain-containing protein n=1 Tax=Thlaspi arvense TaxID=13288 RepID=A0AAU9T631_THLAR|nr:unnamed protein product [Thlaspi arvense]
MLYSLLPLLFLCSSNVSLPFLINVPVMIKVDFQKLVMREAKKRSLMLLDPDVIDCPICFEQLKIPVFQCDNEHLACSSCCLKLSGKCPSCALPIGNNRCRAMETVLESIFVCAFSQCSFPAQDCDYAGSYMEMWVHYSIHLESVMQIYEDITLNFGISFTAELNMSDKVVRMGKYPMGLLFVVQRFKEPCGVYVTVSCIAPSSPAVGKFSYVISYTVEGHTITYESPEVKRVLEVSFQTPQESFMLIPNSFLRGELLKLMVCIKRLN